MVRSQIECSSPHIGQINVSAIFDLGSGRAVVVGGGFYSCHTNDPTRTCSRYGVIGIHAHRGHGEIIRVNGCPFTQSGQCGGICAGSGISRTITEENAHQNVGGNRILLRRLAGNQRKIPESGQTAVLAKTDFDVTTVAGFGKTTVVADQGTGRAVGISVGRISGIVFWSLSRAYLDTARFSRIEQYRRSADTFVRNLCSRVEVESRTIRGNILNGVRTVVIDCSSNADDIAHAEAIIPPGTTAALQFVGLTDELL